MAFIDLTPTVTRNLPNPIRALQERMKARKAAKAQSKEAPQKPAVDWRMILESMSATPTNPYCLEYAQYMLDQMRTGPSRRG